MFELFVHQYIKRLLHSQKETEAQGNSISLLLFLRDRPPEERVSFLGEMLYWITALWLPVIFTRREPGGPLFGELPNYLTLSVASVTLVGTIALSITSNLYIDKTDWLQHLHSVLSNRNFLQSGATPKSTYCNARKCITRFGGTE